MLFNEQQDLNRIISDFYRDIDPKVVKDNKAFKDNEYLEQIQRNCVAQANPFACYFTLTLGETPPKITWRHNINRHFGITDLQYEDFFTLIHPAWLSCYINYVLTIFRMADSHPELALIKGISTGFWVPLRQRSGKYFWYHKISVKAGDDGSNMDVHLNYYHQSVVYEGQLPTMPSIITSGEPNPVLMAELSVHLQDLLPGFLNEFLSKSQTSFMLQYRKVVATETNSKKGQQELLAQIEGVDTIENLNKIKQRIRKKTITHFQHPFLDSAHALGVFLNNYFPLIAIK